MISFLISVLLLAAFVAGGIALIVATRETVRKPGADRGGCDETWEHELAQYKNLRDRGVLEEDEYRRIRRLVDPSSPFAQGDQCELPPASAEGEQSQGRRN